MRFRKLAILSGLALAAASAVVFGANGKPSVKVSLTPTDTSVALRNYAPLDNFLAVTPDKLLPADKLPKTQGEMLYGAVRLGEKGIAVNVAVEKLGKAKDTTYRVYRDRNGNSSLADERASDWIKPGETRTDAVIVGGKHYWLRYSIDADGKVYLRYADMTAASGYIEDGAAKARIVFIDGNNDGDYIDRVQDRVGIDLNGDNVIDAGKDSAEIIHFDDDFLFNNGGWVVGEIKPDATSVTLTSVGAVNPAAEALAVKPQIGFRAPNIVEESMDKQKISLRDYRGKVVLLDFWATWCPPCRREVPNVVAVYKEFKDKGLVVIGISDDNTASAVREFTKTAGMSWPQIIDENNDYRVNRLYGIEAIPRAFVIDRDGVITAVDVRGSDLRDAIQQTIEKK